VSYPSDTEWLALAHEQARDITKRCDELIAQAERELLYLASHPDNRRPHLAVEHKAGRFSLASLTEPPSVQAPAANSN
jgi:hypothetical protein